MRRSLSMANTKAVKLSAVTTDQLFAGREAAMSRIQEVNLSVNDTLVFTIGDLEWDNWDRRNERAIVADKDECVSNFTVLAA